MQATITSVPRSSGGSRSHDVQSCTRCGGLMVHERCMDIGESLGGYWFWAQRCIQCGDLVDEVILQNRSLPAHRVELEEEIVQAA